MADFPKCLLSVYSIWCSIIISDRLRQPNVQHLFSFSLTGTEVTESTEYNDMIGIGVFSTIEPTNHLWILYLAKSPYESESDLRTRRTQATVPNGVEVVDFNNDGRKILTAYLMFLLDVPNF